MEGGAILAQSAHPYETLDLPPLLIVVVRGGRHCSVRAEDGGYSRRDRFTNFRRRVLKAGLNIGERRAHVDFLLHQLAGAITRVDQALDEKMGCIVYQYLGGLVMVVVRGG